MLTSCANYEVRGCEQQQVSKMVKLHMRKNDEFYRFDGTAMQNFNEVDAAFDWKCALNAFKTLGWYFSQILPDPHVNGQWLSF